MELVIWSLSILLGRRFKRAGYLDMVTDTFLFYTNKEQISFSTLFIIST